MQQHHSYFVLSKDLKILLLNYSDHSLLASWWLEHSFLVVLHTLFHCVFRLWWLGRSVVLELDVVIDC